MPVIGYNVMLLRQVIFPTHQGMYFCHVKFLRQGLDVFIVEKTYSVYVALLKTDIFQCVFVHGNQ